MPLHTLNYPSHVLGHRITRKSLSNTRLKPVLAVPPPSSILLRTDESKFPDSKKGSSSTGGSSDLVLGQGNTVGIIGGISVNSTVSFVRKLVEWSSVDGSDSLPFMVCSDPVLGKELLLHERNSFPSLSRQNEHPLQDTSLILANVRSKMAFLEESGARCLVMPCHILHSWHDEISEGSSAHVLHMGESVAQELKEANLKPLEAGSPLRIGVLGTDLTFNAGFYQEKLQNEGFEVILPDKATMEHTVIPAIEALERKDIEGAQNLFRIALQVLLVRAVNRIILASDAMNDLLPHNDPLLKKCINPMDALVRSTINWAKSAQKGT